MPRFFMPNVKEKCDDFHEHGLSFFSNEDEECGFNNTNTSSNMFDESDEIDFLSTTDRDETFMSDSFAKYAPPPPSSTFSLGRSIVSPLTKPISKNDLGSRPFPSLADFKGHFDKDHKTNEKSLSSLPSSLFRGKQETFADTKHSWQQNTAPSAKNSSDPNTSDMFESYFKKNIPFSDDNSILFRTSVDLDSSSDNEQDDSDNFFAAEPKEKESIYSKSVIPTIKSPAVTEAHPISMKENDCSKIRNATPSTSSMNIKCSVDTTGPDTQSSTKMSEDGETTTECKMSTTDKFKLLHMKLKMEASKIQQWRDSVEIELKEKARRLEEAESMIQNLRSNNLNLRNTCEQQSMQLKDEIDGRESVVANLESTRKLCHVVKEEVENAQVLFKQIEKEKTNVGKIHDTYKKAIETSNKTVNLVMKKALQLRQDCQAKITELQQELEVVRATLRGKDAQCQAEVDTAKKRLEEKIALCDQLKKERESLFQNMHKILTEKGLLESSLCEKMELCQRLEKADRDQIAEIDRLKKEAASQKDHLQAIQRSLDEATHQSDSHLSALKPMQKLILRLTDGQESQQEELTTLQKCIESCLRSLETMECDMRLRQQKFMKDEDDLRLNALQYKATSSRLQSEVTQLKKSEIEMTHTVQLLNTTIRELTSERNSLKQKLEDQRKVLTESEIRRENADSEIRKLSDALGGLNIDLQEKTAQLNQHTKTISHLEDALEKEKDVNRQYKKSIEECETTLAEKRSELAQQIQNFNDINDELRQTKDTLDERDEEIGKITATLQDLQRVLSNEETKTSAVSATLKKEISDLSNAKQLLLKEVTSLKSANDDKERKLKRLEEELRVQKVKCAEVESELSECKEQLDESKREVSELMISLDANKAAMESQTESMKEYMSTIEELQKKNQELTRDKCALVREGDRVRNELVYNLGKYKNEMDIIVVKKNGEIEELKLEIEHLTTYKEKDQLYEATKLRVDELENLQIVLKEQKSDIMNKYSSLEKKHNETMKDVSERVKENNDLKIKVKTMEEKLCQALTEERSTKDKLSELQETVEKLQEIVNEASAKNVSSVNESMQTSPLMFDTANVASRIRIIGNQCRTPKSPGVPALTKLSHEDTVEKTSGVKRTADLTDTPNSAIRSILKQPGSGSKKRKVNFDVDAASSESSEIDFFSLPGIAGKVILQEAESLQRKSPLCKKTATTRIAKTRGTATASNIRRTPKKNVSGLVLTEPDELTWLDSDMFKS